MDIKILLNNLREEVSCSVCSNIFTDPKHLSCLHSFCLQCLKQWYRTSGGRDTIRCPNCQAVSEIPKSGNLKDLPTSFYLNGLIDVLAIKECRSGQVRCGNCDKKSSETSYCFQCCAFWCEECVIGHNIMRDNKDHRVLALKDFQDKDYEDVLKRPSFCPKQGHKKEELKYFCKNCETAVCQACVTVDHGGHTMKLIEEEAERQKTEMKSLVEAQRRNLEAKLNVVRRLDEDYAKLIQQGEDVKQDVQRIVDNLHALIEAKKQNIFSAVENQTMKSLDSVTNRKTKTEEQITVIKSSLEKADKLLTRSSSAEVVELKKSLEMILEEVDQTEQTDEFEGLPVRIAFAENQKLLNIVNTEEIGYLEISGQTKASQSVAEGKGLEESIVGSEEEFVLFTRDFEGRQCYNEHDRVTVEIRDEQGRESATEVRINDNKDGSYKISYCARDQGRYKVTVKVNGQHVRDSPFNVQLIKPFMQVRPVLSFGEQGSTVGMFKCPWGVAVNARDEIAVTDSNHRIQIFNSDGKHLRSFGRHGNKAGEFERPRGIAFHKNGNFFVVDNGNCRIQIFSGEGEYVGMFGGKGSRLDSQLSNPCGLSVDSDGNIIVADSGNKLIKIFSPDGKLLKTIGGQGSFTFPIHCIQCDRHLIVSDSHEHCIKVLDRNGKFQYKFGKKGEGDGEFNDPRCLSVNKSGQLMVCNTGNNQRIQVFGLNGKFLGKFGTMGSNLGEFSLPWSVAVLSNDRIVVTDLNNHRLQLFE